MPGEDLTSVFMEVWNLIVANPGVALIFFLALFLGLLLIFHRLRVVTPWTLALAFIIAAVGTALTLLQLWNWHILSTLITLVLIRVDVWN
jgi:hypothetical protein